MAEGMSRKEADLFEEMGVVTDDEAGLSCKEFAQLLPKRR